MYIQRLDITNIHAIIFSLIYSIQMCIYTCIHYNVYYNIRVNIYNIYMYLKKVLYII